MSVVNRPRFQREGLPLQRKKVYQVLVQFILAQKGAEQELRQLSLLIGGRLSFQKGYGGHNLSVQLTNLKVILRYFRVFPLKTIKRVSLIKFLHIYSVIIKSIADRRILNQAELAGIRYKAKEINKVKTLVEDKVRPTK